MTQPELIPPPMEHDPYALLGKPTLELTDADQLAIIDELRNRRRSFLLGQMDKKPRVKAAPKLKAIPAPKGSIAGASLMDDL